VDESALYCAAQRLRVDSRLIEVASALRAGGIEPVLLKGPAIARWLYAEDPSARPYVDVDLLVAPGDRAKASAVLVGLGYVKQGEPMPDSDEPHARAYERDSDAVAVDLHRVLHGMESLCAERVWQAVSTDSEHLRIADVDIAIPNETVRTLHLVLHLSPRDGPGSKPWADLQRGLALIDAQTWHRAAQLARSLGIENEMGHRLANVPAAAALVAELRLPQRETDLWAAMRVTEAGSHARGVVSLLQFSARPGARERSAYVRAKLFPPSEVLRERHRIARGGRGGIALARALWVATCALRLPGAIHDWRRQRRGEPRH
jgi:hypothetical protein